MSDDFFNGTNGNDIFNGGSGADVVTFAGNASDYRIETLENGRIQVTDLNKRDGNTGVDILTGIETLSFADKNFALSNSLTNGAQGEFRVNTHTPLDQTSPTTTALADGGFIITWSSPGQDGSSTGIYTQRYDARGNAVGGETQVNTTTLFHQEQPVITATSNGGYIVAWQSWYQDFDTPNQDNMWGIVAQRFDANGNKLGGEIHVNTFTTSNQQNASITELADGGFVVTWESFEQEGVNLDLGIFAQRFDANGNKIGVETQINTYTDNAQTEATVAALNDGGYLIAWSSYGEDAPSGFGVFTQRFDANGNPVGVETQINTYTSNWQDSPSITVLNDGGYVISWNSFRQLGDPQQYDIFLQRFDADGNPVGVETQVNTNTANWDQEPEIVALVDGGYVVVWESASDINGSNGNIYAQRFDASGAKVGAETLINSTTFDSQNMPDITALADGGFVATWHSVGQDGSEGSIYAQRFDAEGNPWGANTLQINGTAGADTINAGKGDQMLQGFGGNDTLIGGSGLDTLVGGNGADILIGGQGKDSLKGGVGPDIFRFQDALGSGFDRVRDFDTNDTLQLDHAVYTQLSAGALNTANFVANASGTAADGNDYLVYNSTTGDLFYDANGSAAGGSTLIAKLTGAPALTAADFDVI